MEVIRFRELRPGEDQEKKSDKLAHFVDGNTLMLIFGVH